MNKQKISVFLIFSVMMMFLVGVDSIDQVNAEKIPDWVNGVFNWYVQGNISEDELIKSLEFLIDSGILVVPGGNIISEPILHELTKPELLFWTDELVYGDTALLWIEEHTSYMENASAQELMEKLKSPNGVYYLVILPEKYGVEFTVIDTSGNQIKYDDLLVVPMTCDSTIYTIQGFGISEMYFMYNDVRFDSSSDIMTGFCQLG